MDFDTNQFDEQTDITRFLEKFSQDASVSDFAFSRPVSVEENKPSLADKQEQYERSFAKLEDKIRELEEKFEASTAQNEAVMKELARTREAVENQKSKDAFFANITTTIANLKESVENLSRAQQSPRLYNPAPAPNRAFDTSSAEYMAMGNYLPDTYRSAQQSKLEQERDEKKKALAELTLERQNKKQVLEELQNVQAEKIKALEDLQNTRAEKEQVFATLEKTQQEKDQVWADLQASQEQNTKTLTDLQNLQAEKEQVWTDLQNTKADKEQALSQLQNAKTEKEKILSDYTAVQLQKDQVLSELQNAKTEKEKILSDYTAVQLQKDQAWSALETEKAEKNRLLADWQEEKSRSEMAITQLKSGYEEKARFISSLHQKASQLKAVNVALEREIKRVQEERIEALRKSAEQAKEILSLRDALTAAEERFKSFDFEGRIISIKRQYEQKVTKLENQLHEISNTCMKQVEEIEALKAENLKLHRIAEEREQLAALYEAKTRELESLQASVAQLRSHSGDTKTQARLAAFTHRMQRLQKEHEVLAERLTQAQEALKAVTAEKQTLQENFKVLLAKIEKNDAVIENLKKKIAVLTEENRELKSRSASKTIREPLPTKEPATIRQPVTAAKTAPVVRAATKTSRELPQPETAPVGMQNTMRSKVQTEADLPEIRVADPIPQPEQSFDGDDFLTKTDSFIGRMKWSIFREDK